MLKERYHLFTKKVTLMCVESIIEGEKINVLHFGLRWSTSKGTIPSKESNTKCILKTILMCVESTT